jgi:hypothetical protein
MAFGVLCKARELTIVKNGESKAVIVLAKKPTRSAQMGAYELQHNIKLITDVKVPIITNPDKAKGKIRIFVGESAGTKKQGYSGSDFSGETHLVKFKGNDIILMGNDSPDYQKVDYQKAETFPSVMYNFKGSLYAVYAFLENQCGIRFYGISELETTYKKRKALSVKAVDRKFDPPLTALRYVNRDDKRYTKFKYSAREVALWRLRWRMNVMYGMTNHNFYSIYYRYWGIPKWGAERKEITGLFVEKRPEYFAAGFEKINHPRDPLMRAGYGNGPGFPPTICFTNPDVPKYYAEEAMCYFKGNNSLGGYKNFRGKIPANKTLLPKLPGRPFFYPIEQGDTGGACKCKKCQSSFPDQPKKEHFANLKFQWISNIAKEAAKKNPELGISTLAYINSLYYPKGVNIAKNVSVQLCLTIYSWWHPGIRKVQEGAYNQWIKKEAKRRPITLWTYIFSSHWDMKRHFRQKYFFPAVYPWEIGKLFKKFTNDGIKGWFTEVEMQYNTLETYVAARICFDPSLDPNQIIDEYFRNYYGAAAGPMKKFYREIENAYWNKNNYPQGWFRSAKVLGPLGVKKGTWGTGFHSPEVNWGIGTKKRVAELNSIIRQAQKLAETPAERARIQRLIDGMWAQAVEGRKKFKSGKNYQLAKKTKAKFAIIPFIAGPAEKLKDIDWTKAAQLANWQGLDGEKIKNTSCMQILRDEKNLYLRYKENIPAKTIKKVKNNSLEMFFAASPQLPVLNLKVLPSGKIEQFKYEIINDITSKGIYNFKAKIVNSLKENSWSFIIAIPLEKLPRLKKGSKSYTVNFVRNCGLKNSVIWSPVVYGDKTHISALKYFGKLCLSPEVIIQDSKFALVDATCNRVNDAVASDGKAVLMDGNKGWTVRYLIPDVPQGKYRVYVDVRSDVDVQKGLTTRVGVYNAKTKRLASVKTIKIVDINGMKYKRIYVGAVKLTPDMYIYMGRFNKKLMGKKSVYIDRIMLRAEGN